jgi:hypothetical protein
LTGAQPVDVQEVRKLDAYLKRLFDNARIRVVPRPEKDESAEVYLGEEGIAELSSDDEDGEKSFNFRMEIELKAEPTEQLKKLDAYLKDTFQNDKLRVVTRVKKTDSLELYLGDEFIGVLFIDDPGKGKYILEIPILEFDLQ